jgi:hypothetical protein
MMDVLAETHPLSPHTGLFDGFIPCARILGRRRTMSRRIVRPSLLFALLLVLSLSSPCTVVSTPVLDPPMVVVPQAIDHCPQLDPPSGNIVNVSTEAELVNAVGTASSGDVILIADGTYDLYSGDEMWIDESNVELRSASGNREAVILDGHYDATEIVTIAASDVVIANLTLRRAKAHPIHVVSLAGAHTLGTLIYNVHIVDPREQAIKINPAASGYYVDDGTVACSHIELTDVGRPHVQPVPGGCYTGGVDAHQAMGWTIRDNVIEGFWCNTGLSEHGIHMWVSCNGTVVERNVLRNNARGIGFGMHSSDPGGVRAYAPDPCPSALGGYVDHYGGIIRNNFIFADDSGLFASPDGFDSGISMWQACGAWVVHNTVVSTQQPAASSIEWRFDNTDIDLVNNLVSYRLWDRGGTGRQSNNLEYQPLSLFVDGSGGDLHLLDTATAAIDQGAAVSAGLCDDDIDGDTRPVGSAPDVGADEYRLAVPDAVTDLRVTQAVNSTATLTATLQWTAPTDAMTTTLRFSYSPITTEGVWSGAMTLTDTLPGGDEVYTATVSFEGGTAYFCLKTANDSGFSDLSNNAVWPRFDAFLPSVLKAY